MLPQDDFPSFPSDAQTIKVPILEFLKLIEHDESESTALFEACKLRGIFLLNLKGDARGERLLEQTMGLFSLAESLFNLDHDEKMKYALSWRNTNGYKSAGMGKIDSKGTPDRCEFYTVGRDELTGAGAARPQPREIEEVKTSLRCFMEQSTALVFSMFTCLETHLHLPYGTFAAKHRLDEPSGSQTRLLRYEPQPPSDRRTSLVAHTDLGSLTILFNILGGLQLLVDPSLPESEDNWAYIKPIPGHAIVNVGDALATWTNGLFKSPKHRVSYAPGEQANLTRYSVAFFARPEHQTLMTRLEGSDVVPELKEGQSDEKITAEEWHARHSAVHAAKGQETSK